MDVQEKNWPSYGSLSSPTHRVPPHMYSVPPPTQSHVMHTSPSVDMAPNYIYSHQQQHPGPTSPSVSSPVAYMPPSRSSSIRRSYPGFSMSQPTTPRPGSPDSQAAREDSKQSHGYVSNGPGAIRRKHKESEPLHEESPPFGATKYKNNIYALDRSTLLNVRIHSKVDRGFFMSDNDWTCYRRNYFQISSAFTLEGVDVLYEGQDIPCMVEWEGKLHPVQGFLLGVSARVANSQKIIDLVQHTPKRDKGPQNIPAAKPIRPNGNLAMTSVTNQSVVCFERVQFKAATANNGKRRAAQQYYVLYTDLFCKIDADEPVLVAQSMSSPLVVRGRSPGHYAESDAGGKRVRHDSSPQDEHGSLSSRLSQSPFMPHSGSGMPPPSADYPPYGYPSYSPFGPVPSMHTVMSASSPQPSYDGRSYVPGIHDRTQSGETSSTHSEMYGSENNHPRYQHPRVPSDNSWARLRIASNTSHTSVDSVHSPYMNADPSNPYYSQPMPSYPPSQSESPHQQHSQQPHPSHLPPSSYHPTVYDARASAPMAQSHLPPSSSAVSDRGYPASYTDVHWRHDTSRLPHASESHQEHLYESRDGNGGPEVNQAEHANNRDPTNRKGKHMKETST